MPFKVEKNALFPLRTYPNPTAAQNAALNALSHMVVSTREAAKIIYSVCCHLPEKARQHTNPHNMLNEHLKQGEDEDSTGKVYGPAHIVVEKRLNEIKRQEGPDVIFEVWRVCIEPLNGDSAQWKYVVVPQGQIRASSPRPFLPPPPAAA